MLFFSVFLDYLKKQTYVTGYVLGRPFSSVKGFVWNNRYAIILILNNCFYILFISCTWLKLTKKYVCMIFTCFTLLTDFMEVFT